MAPARQREPSVEQTTEYDEFIGTLAAFHQKRGTSFDPAPKVGSHRVDLLRLYNRVKDMGGYDVASDKKATPLAWRNLTEEFQLGTKATYNQLAFQLKTAYYKNLCAYEISDWHKKEPPPKEILEDQTAAGGAVMTRTLENYNGRRVSWDAQQLANGRRSSNASEGEEEKTPREDKMDMDDPESVGRVGRGLRQQPPQRMLFQPDTLPARGRQSVGRSPAPSFYGHTNGTYAGSGTSVSLANYEPGQPRTLATLPIPAPAQNPSHFKALQEKRAKKPQSTTQQYAGMVLPGTGYKGPNIYTRALCALRSGIPEEEDYALHHLVKISHERGDRYKFSDFTGLADALLDKLLEVSRIYCNADWEISYDASASGMSDNTLNGLEGTRDIVPRIKRAKTHDTRGTVEARELSSRIRRVNEAALVVRNMVMLEDNAQHISQYPALRDILSIVLNLPESPAVVELHHYALEIAEQLTRYWALDAEDPVYISLVHHIDSTDRGAALTALRAIDRIGIARKAFPSVKNIPLKAAQQIVNWLHVDDEELQVACLDFLYHYTIHVSNVAELLGAVPVAPLIRRLVRLLLFNARYLHRPNSPTRQPRKTPDTPSPTTSVPRIPHSLIQSLLHYEEPNRSSQWLRCVFHEVPNGEITQILLWQAYQSIFHEYATIKPILPAKDFITNVSTTFAGASAQVLNVVDKVTGQTQPRFIIKGISARETPVDTRGKPYMRCLWHPDNVTAQNMKGNECGAFEMKPSEMWFHVVDAHLGVAKAETGGFNRVANQNGQQTEEKRYSCKWGGCERFSKGRESTSAHEVAMHIKTHLPGEEERERKHQKPSNSSTGESNGNSKPISGSSTTAQTEQQQQQQSEGIPFALTEMDGRSHPSGPALAAVMILRNLARNIPKVVEDSNKSSEGRRRTGTENEDEDMKVLHEAFGHIKNDLFHVMAHNTSLREYWSVLTNAISAAEESVQQHEHE